MSDLPRQNFSMMCPGRESHHDKCDACGVRAYLQCKSYDKALQALDYSLRFRGGVTFHRWLQELLFMDFIDGGKMTSMFPMGVNRSPADVDDCIRDAEAAGLVQWTGGYTGNTSLIAWRGLQYAGRHPSKRPSTAGGSEKCWKQGPNRELLKEICEKPWSAYEAEGAWKAPR